MTRDAQARLAPVAVDSLVQIVYDAIRGLILNGRYSLGEHIVELRVAAELQTSRAPVREALRRLQQEGLVVEKPRRGFFVREITAADFIDIYNVRIAIECAAARLVARRQPPLDAVERTIAKMHEAALRGEIGTTVDLELLVHQQICEASGNDYLASVFRSVAGPARMALGLDDAAYARLEDVATEHLPLLEALRSGDGALAATAIHQHIVSTVGPVLARLGGDEQELLAAPPIAGGSAVG
jgi:DNA-binding GntR family transcriptional regulator